MPEKPTLDIGCGWHKTPGALGMDILAESAADVVADLNQRWPFEDASFDRVIANHVLEHVPDVVHVVNEAWRVLAPSGMLVVRGPHFSSPDLIWSDPTHRRGLSAAMFLHFQPGSAHPYGSAQFHTHKVVLRTAGGRRGETDGLLRSVLRPLYSAYERGVNRSIVARQRAERVWSRWVPFDEVEVQLICAGKDQS